MNQVLAEPVANAVESAEGLEAVERVLSLAAEAEQRAFEVLDDTPLRAVYTGQAMRGYKGQLAQLDASGSYELHRLHSQTIHDLSQFDRGRVRVRMTEVWSVTRFSKRSRQCTSYFARYTNTQTALLRLENGSWKIYSLHGASPLPVPTACP